jgi:hypothetical protein
MALTGTPAAIEITSADGDRCGATSSSTFGRICGLTDGVGVAGADVDAVARLELVAALAPRIRAVNFVRLDDAGGDEPLDERLGHVAGAEKSDRLRQLHG